jgi:hypothetical protein
MTEGVEEGMRRTGGRCRGEGTSGLSRDGARLSEEEEVGGSFPLARRAASFACLCSFSRMSNDLLRPFTALRNDRACVCKESNISATLEKE